MDRLAADNAHPCRIPLGRCYLLLGNMVVVVKIAVVGPERVGKTALIMRATADRFIEQYMPTSKSSG